MRPRLFVTADKIDGLKSLDELRQQIDGGHSASLWEAIQNRAQAELDAQPLLPGSMFPGRSPMQAEYENRDYEICNEAGLRMLRAALVNLVTGESRYAESALRQMAALFDENLWPEWRDKAHQDTPADLRTGMLARDTAIAYDWLHQSLTPEQRAWVVEGIDRRAIRPYMHSLETGAWWVNPKMNWQTVIVGGLGIAAMALGEDHPLSQEIESFATRKMIEYLSIYGRNGEFNESVFYSNATAMPAIYFQALRYFVPGEHDRLADWPFPDTCRWMMHLTLPPGRVVNFGDCSGDTPTSVSFFPAVASAARDGILQWFYLQQINSTRPEKRRLPFELLWCDDTVEPVSPEGRLPLGRTFPEHSGCIISRTTWNPDVPAIIVYGKAGHGSEGHGNHDAGQVCIDAAGEKLIIDLGSPPGYPADFFGPNRYKYYNASVHGHNVPMFGGREMRTGQEHRAVILDSRFDDTKGSSWRIDLTDMYDGLESAIRTVVHLCPGYVAVLDEAKLSQAEEISLRWHTACLSTPDASGAFTVNGEKAQLNARIAALDSAELAFSHRQHSYQPPHNRDRHGPEFKQRNENYVEAVVLAESCKVLTLFAVGIGNEQVPQWTGPDDAGEFRCGSIVVDVGDGYMLMKDTRTELKEIRVEFS